MDLRAELALVRELASALGLGGEPPVLLKAAHHTTLLLPAAGAVARVQSAEPAAMALPRATREVMVARHLARGRAPALPPLDPVAGPHVVGSAVVTFWPFLEPLRVAGDADAAVAAATLARCHAALPAGDGALPPFTDTLDRCRALLGSERMAATLARGDRDLLATHYRRLRHAVEAGTVHWLPLHGDVHLGNLLLARDGARWIDFEDACIGPREWDISGLPPAAWGLFRDVGLDLVECCADLKSVCVAIWCWAELGRSAEMREAADHHLRRVREMPA